MTSPSEGPSFWASLREAIRGSEQELTEIPIRRAVFLLAVPMVLEMGMESLFAIVDIFVVSKLGESAVAAVGLTESLLSVFVYALAIGLAAGTTAIVARRIGEKDPESAATSAVQVIGVATVLSIVLGGIGAFFAHRLLELMGATPAVVAEGTPYTATMLGGSVTIFLLFVINAVFRGAGDASIAMRTLWIANGLNIVLAPCLVLGLGPFPRMGVTGAALATTLSRGVGVGYQILMLRRGKQRVVIGKRHLGVRAPVLRELVKISAPATFQTIIETASWLGLVRILSTAGSAALAGYTIAMRVAIFALLPSWGLANAAATLVGQNLGAGKPDRAERSVTTVATYNVGFLGTVSLVFVVLAGPLVGFFTADPATRELGADCLRIVALGFVLYAFGMVAVQAFNGAGDTSVPMVLNLVCFWLFKIPIAYVLALWAHMGPRGVFIAIAAAYSLQAIVGTILFRTGRWKRKQLSR